jgi:hypothetical protein
LDVAVRIPTADASVFVASLRRRYSGDGKYIKLYLIARRRAEMRQVRLLAWNAIRCRAGVQAALLLNPLGAAAWQNAAFMEFSLEITFRWL